MGVELLALKATLSKFWIMWNFLLPVCILILIIWSIFLAAFYCNFFEFKIVNQIQMSSWWKPLYFKTLMSSNNIVIVLCMWAAVTHLFLLLLYLNCNVYNELCCPSLLFCLWISMQYIDYYFGNKLPVSSLMIMASFISRYAFEVNTNFISLFV